MHHSKWRGLIVGLAAALLISCQAPAQPAEPAQPTAPIKDNRTLGPEDAPITIIEYGDFGCTTCLGWHNQGNLKKILDTYGDKVRFVWRDLPVITPQSPKAAEAGQCAADQGKFWEFHDLAYATFKIDVASLKSYAVQLGLDTAQFNQCLDSGQHTADVDRDWQAAKSLGFRATPDFVINDQPFAGPIPFSQFQSVIDPILAKGS